MCLLLSYIANLSGWEGDKGKWENPSVKYKTQEIDDEDDDEKDDEEKDDDDDDDEEGEGHLSNNCFQSFLHTASHRHLHFQHNNNNQRLDEIGTTTMCVWLGNQV